jgi:hypothetical protein
MFSILNYLEAKSRLEESIKTIEMMGGENECQPMLLGQRDMIELELEYYRERSKLFIAGLLFFIILCATLVQLYNIISKG